jgi:primosomal protein N' (replication factor Y)
MAPRIVDVLVPVALDHAYSYRAPPELNLSVGDIVAVPLGPRESVGVVWADNVAVRPGLHNRLKDVEAKLDYPPLREELRKFVDWVANYTLSPRGMVLRMALRMGDLGPERERVAVRLAGPAPQRMTPARRRVMSALSDGLLRTKSEAAKDAGVSVGVIDGLVDEGTLEVVALPREPVARQPDPDYRTPELSGSQRMAANILRGAVKQGGFAVDLLDGVTGSGKNDVYFEAIADTIRSGRQSLVLMPEIALTGQFLDRFAQRFGTRPAEWHSELGARKRARTWTAVANNEVNVVVGARSALFVPITDIGLIGIG